MKTDVPEGAGLNNTPIELSAAKSGFDISAKPLGGTVFVTIPTTFSEKTCPMAGARVTAVIATVRSKVFVLIKFACFVRRALFCWLEESPSTSSFRGMGNPFHYHASHDTYREEFVPEFRNSQLQLVLPGASSPREFGLNRHQTPCSVRPCQFL